MPLRKQADQLTQHCPSLLIAAERIAASIPPGHHGRRQAGPGETFWQFRNYVPGDSIKHIDWRQSGKADQLYVREREWETVQTLWLWCDRSLSMHYRSQPNKGLFLAPTGPQMPTKFERAGLLTLALACLLVRAGELVGLLDQPGPPTARAAILTRLAQILGEDMAHSDSAPDFTKQAALLQDHSLPPLRALPRHATLIWISDFLAPMDDIVARLRAFAEQGIEGLLVSVNDPAEQSLPFAGRILFSGMENETDLLVRRADLLRTSYQTRLAERNAILADAARCYNWSIIRHITDQPPQNPLWALHGLLAGRIDSDRNPLQKNPLQKNH